MSAADTAQVLVVVTAAVPLVACTVCRCTFLDGRDQRYVMTVQYGDDAA